MRTAVRTALASGVLLGLGLFGCATPASVQPLPRQKGVLSGTVTYAEPVSLPAGALVTVRVWDAVEPLDSATVGEATRPASGQGPLPFEVFFSPDLIQASHAYGARARVTVDGAVWFESEQPVRVLTQGGLTVGVELKVKRVAPVTQ
jgi:uncharacterized lipoprotein YbaY